MSAKSGRREKRNVAAGGLIRVKKRKNHPKQPEITPLKQELMLDDDVLRSFSNKTIDLEDHQ